ETPTPVSVRFCMHGVWFAYQDNGADWQFATAVSDTITFNATQALSIAFGTDDAAFAEVWSLNRQELLELSGSPLFACADQPPITKTLFGALAGLASNEIFSISTGNSAAGGPGTATN